MNIKIVLTSLFLVLLLAVVGAGGFYLGNTYRLVTIGPTPSQAPVVTSAPTPLISIIPTPIPTPDGAESADVLAAVKQGIIADHGPSSELVKPTVTKIVGNFAQGNATTNGGSATWFAAKVKGTWVLVWDGTGTVACNSVAPYPDFPKDMIAECWNDTLGKTITR